MMNLLLAALAAGCACLALGLWVDRRIVRPIERRWRR